MGPGCKGGYAKERNESPPSMSQYMSKDHNFNTTIKSSLINDYKIYKFGNRVIDFKALYVEHVEDFF